MASFGKFVFFTFIFISTALSGFESHSSVNSNDSQQLEKISCKFYCSEKVCPFFYQNPFDDEDSWKKHLAYDHFICVDCSLYLASENNFLKHCDHTNHSCYSKKLYLQYVQDSGTLSDRFKSFESRRQQADFQSCCPFKDCKFHYEPLIFPVDLKAHLAVEHCVCWVCYYSKDSSIHAFLTRRELIAHWIDMSHEEDQHGLDFCLDCFDNKLVSDSKIFLASSSLGLELHQRSHNNLELSSQPRSSWQQPGNYLPAESGETSRRASSAPCLEQYCGTLEEIKKKKKRKRSCPVEGCKFYKKNMTTPANFKVHLASQHNMCAKCYWDTNRQISFLTRRKLIEHFMHNSSRDSLHGVLYCRKCFQDPEVPDLKVFMAAVPAKLQKHDESHS